MAVKPSEIPALSSELAERWHPEDAEELYRLGVWSEGYFRVDEQGRVVVKAESNLPVVVIEEVVEELLRRDITMPVLLRFQDILRSRVVRLNEAFAAAIEEAGYGADYRSVYPVKVNQLHEVVEEVLEAGAPYGLGLECGSKAELVAALAHVTDDETPLVCNGVKDGAMLRLVLATQSIGRNVLPVMEKFGEFRHIMRLGGELGVTPRFGVRVRLGTSGSGRWAESGGDMSKFGVSVPELVSMLDELAAAGALDCLRLVHFHLGSQIDDIQIVRQGVKEIAQIYAQIRQRGAAVEYLDVGGGLGVNYGAGYSETDTGINYGLQEYANAIVYAVKQVCEANEVPPPNIISESGRALTAHHSVLVVPVLGTSGKDFIDPDFEPLEEHENVIHELFEVYLNSRELGFPDYGERSASELQEALHDAVEKRREADSLFTLGYLTLEQKAIAERLYWSTCATLHKALELLGEDTEVPAELQFLDQHLVDQLLCDFSIFQSILDHWSIGQGFPVMPLARLDEPPSRRAVLVDLTCDSDGKVSHYVSSSYDKRFLPVHAPRGETPYYLGFFMMGAYQDIMGDSHNLFGRVAEAHVYADEEEPGGFYIEQIIPGTSVREMLAMVQYFPNDLHRRMNEQLRQKTDAGVIRPRQAVELLEQYMRLFSASTYIDPEA